MIGKIKSPRTGCVIGAYIIAHLIHLLYNLSTAWYSCARVVCLSARMFFYVACILLVLSAAIAAPAGAHNRAGPITPVFQFGYGVELENLAIRPNGNILVTEPSPKARVWEIVPSQDGGNGTATAIAEFNATSALGIASIGPDTYAITSGNLGSNFAGEVGSFALNILEYSTGQPEITVSIPLPSAHMANKVTALDPPGDVILVSDPQGAQILSVNVETHEVQVALNDSETMGVVAGYPIGVNGIHTVGNKLYFINTSKGIFNRVQITAQGTAAGPFETIANYSSVQLLADDFGITSCGDAFLAGSNQILHVSPNGTLNVIAGNEQSTELPGPTSALFGHGARARTLYITTTGHVQKPATSGYIENGKVVSIQIFGI